MICTGCGLEINDRAPTCFQCGTINELVPRTGPFISQPAVYGGNGAPRWIGGRLYLPELAQLPLRVCWVCGLEGPDIQPTTKKLQYTPSYAYLGYLAGLLPGLILGLVLTRSLKPRFPLCSPCRKRWVIAQVAFVTFTIFGLFALPMGGAFIGDQLAHAGGLPVGLIAGFGTWIAGVLALRYLVCARVQIWATAIDNGVAALRLPNPHPVRRALDEKSA